MKPIKGLKVKRAVVASAMKETRDKCRARGIAQILEIAERGEAEAIKHGF